MFWSQEISKIWIFDEFIHFMVWDIMCQVSKDEIMFAVGNDRTVAPFTNMVLF